MFDGFYKFSGKIIFLSTSSLAALHIPNLLSFTQTVDAIISLFLHIAIGAVSLFAIYKKYKTVDNGKTTIQN